MCQKCAVMLPVQKKRAVVRSCSGIGLRGNKYVSKAFELKSKGQGKAGQWFHLPMLFFRLMDSFVMARKVAGGR